MNNCPNCNHPKINHVPDGTGTTCLICMVTGNHCGVKFQFQLSQQEREQAARATKDAYDQMDVCAICDQYWMQHMGYLCPSGDSVFIKKLDSSLPFLRTH